MQMFSALCFLTVFFLSGDVVSPGAASIAQSKCEAVTSKPSVTLAAALTIAQKCLEFGRTKGAHMAVVVTDQSGLPLVMLRDDQASEQFVDGATSKAWTAVNLKDSTSNLLKMFEEGKEDNRMLPNVPKALFLMGGEPLKIGDTIVGAVGTAGSPSGLVDAAAAAHGRQVFEEMLKKQ